MVEAYAKGRTYLEVNMPSDNEYRNRDMDVERLERSFTHTNPPPRTEPPTNPEPTNQQSSESGESNSDGNSSTSNNS